MSQRIATAAVPGRRPLRSLALAAGALAGLAALVQAGSNLLSLGSSGDAAAFCGGTGCSLRPGDVDVAGGVAMNLKSRTWSQGIPNKGMMMQKKFQMPSVSNMKDSYYVLWVRSKKVKQWKAINIVSGTEAQKGLKDATDNDLAKAVGADKLADSQIVRALGMNIYGQKEEVTKQAIQMHPSLKFASELQFGYKEIQNNTAFNEKPDELMNTLNISVIPPEEELKNIIDKAGETINATATSVSKVGDNIKGFLNGMR